MSWLVFVMTASINVMNIDEQQKPCVSILTHRVSVYWQLIWRQQSVDCVYWRVPHGVLRPITTQYSSWIFIGGWQTIITIIITQLCKYALDYPLSSWINDAQVPFRNARRSKLTRSPNGKVFDNWLLRLITWHFPDFDRPNIDTECSIIAKHFLQFEICEGGTIHHHTD